MILQFTIGSLIALAVARTIVGFREPLDSEMAPEEREKLRDPEEVYRTQKQAALILGIAVILPFYVWALLNERFFEFGGPLLVPVALIGPGLYLYDLLKDKEPPR